MSRDLASVAIVVDGREYQAVQVSNEILEALFNDEIGTCTFKIYGYFLTARSRGELFHRFVDIFESYPLSRASVSAGLKELVGLDLVRKVQFSPDEAVLFCKSKRSQRASFGQRCVWCQGMSPALEKHHYPIPRSQGGTQTISICGSCHAEFHALTDGDLYAIAGGAS